MRASALPVVALLVLTGGALAGCQPGPSATPTPPSTARVMPDAPVRDDDEQPKHVIATTRFRCDEPGASTMTLTMHLQHQNSSGTWVDVNSTTFTAKGHDTVPTKGEAFRTRQVTANCAEGVFRTTVAGSSQSRGNDQEVQPHRSAHLRPLPAQPLLRQGLTPPPVRSP